MPAKIRLQRHGKKGAPFYHIVVADSRAPRDGRFIERIGSYNPITNPATIDVNTDRAAEWMMKGAQPTDTARAILSYKGVLYRLHLNKGVAKGALTQEQADAKFATWTQEKSNKIDNKKKKLGESADKIRRERLAAEAKLNEARIEEMKRKAAEAALGAVATEEAPAEGGEAAAEGEAPAEA